MHVLVYVSNVDDLGNLTHIPTNIKREVGFQQVALSGPSPFQQEGASQVSTSSLTPKTSTVFTFIVLLSTKSQCKYTLSGWQKGLKNPYYGLMGYYFVSYLRPLNIYPYF